MTAPPPTPGKAAECTTAYTNAVKRQSALRRSMPPAKTASPSLAKASASRRQPGAGVAPENQAQAQSSGSFWMPLMAGYMMGRLMGGGMAQQQPLFSSKNPASPAYGQYTDASGRAMVPPSRAAP